MTNPDKYNKAMNQLLESKEYGIENYDDKRMINNNINISSENNVNDNQKCLELEVKNKNKDEEY